MALRSMIGKLKRHIESLERCPHCGHSEPTGVEGCPCDDARCVCAFENNR